MSCNEPSITCRPCIERGACDGHGFIVRIEEEAERQRATLDAAITHETDELLLDLYEAFRRPFSRAGAWVRPGSIAAAVLALAARSNLTPDASPATDREED